MKFLTILGIIVQFHVIVSHTDIPGIPEDILDTFIKKHADLSVDPCDDFYAHVCNRRARGQFDVSMYEHKMSIIEKSWKKYPYGGVTNLELSHNTEAMRKLLDKRYFEKKLCTKKTLNFFLDIVAKKTGDCRTVYSKMKKIVRKIEHNTMFVARVARALVVFNEIKFLDEQLRQLFSKIIAEMRYLIENTGWIKDKGVTKQYLKTLDRVKLFTYHNFQQAANDYMNNYIKYFDKCIDKYHFPSNLQENLCQFYGVHMSTIPLREKSIVIDTFSTSEIEEILKDDFAVFSSKDKNINVGNDFLLLVNSKYISSVYGSIGYIMCHELMHTFIFDEHDRNAELYNHWTNDTSCIKQQSKKTCQTYRTAACSSDHQGHDHTFEEDGVDYMGYRLIHNLFHKQNFQRKMHVKDIDSLNKNQLFFYGAATVFCDYSTYTSGYIHHSEHTNRYQRVNSMVSQIDEFAQAFKCKATDRIVQNKAAHCEIYGNSSNGRSQDQDIGQGDRGDQGGHQDQYEDQAQDQGQQGRDEDQVQEQDQDGGQDQGLGGYQGQDQYQEQGRYQDQDKDEYQDQGRGEFDQDQYQNQDQDDDQYRDQGEQGGYQDQDEYEDQYQGRGGYQDQYQDQYQDDDQYRSQESRGEHQDQYPQLGRYQDQDQYPYEDQNQGGRGGLGSYQNQYQDQYQSQGGRVRYQKRDQYPYSSRLGQDRYQDQYQDEYQDQYGYQDQYPYQNRNQGGRGSLGRYQDQDYYDGWYRKSAYNQTESQVNPLNDTPSHADDVDNSDNNNESQVQDTDGQKNYRQSQNDLFYTV